ncbi:hypothetical protein SAMN04487972_11744 [Paracoccus halophilus]|uniref:Yip1 domain-containing protein n=1 Tax=Paracoccus halophilus TaxID=376733 RepID=A0A099EZ42_9RHOB|nr:hypothetical protein [Paracoccus halophilus]KGJ03720.1 hypothetical protein IT41_13115 [Paracoccus halophilus]SFA57387.1 hypothetical protein SAMN04487972_11744 [Paracoccus halophilus]
MVRAGIVPRILESWRAPGRVILSLRGMPDRVLIAVLMSAMLVFLIAQTPGHARAAQLDPSVPFQARIGGALMAVMFILPLLAYAVAAAVAGLSRLTPWPVAARDSRLALFWALLAVAPAMLLAGLVEGLMGAGAALSLTRALAGLGFVVIWGAGLRALAGQG